MADPKPCHNCADHGCEENPYNEDGECWGTMTREERVELAQYLLAEQRTDIPSVKLPYQPLDYLV
jgi:hypothetical protein